MKKLTEHLKDHFAEGKRLWLFLDYDGTLADFAPTPDTIIKDEELNSLLDRMAQFPDVLRVVIMSGRRLSHIEALLPAPEILLAGTYGIEYRTWEGERVRLLDFDSERPFLDQVKAEWSALVDDLAGFYIEDKGYSLALHGRDAEEKICREVLAEAAQAARSIVEKGTFRMMGGSKFLEVAPLIANKGQSVSTLLKRFSWPNAEIIYIGDDDKDEEAFKVVKGLGGTAILVTNQPRPTLADYQLANPATVRAWLRELLHILEFVRA